MAGTSLRFSQNQNKKSKPVRGEKREEEEEEEEEVRGQAYDFTFNAGLFVGSRERGPYVTFPRNICERHLFSRSCPKLRTLVDSLTPRAD